MTEPVFGSSLPQARDQQHNHYRFHTGSSRHSYHEHKRHQHQHHHARSQSRKNTHKRNNSEPTTIVETISVLQLIDATGGVITVQTLPTSSPPTPAATTTNTAESQPASASASTSTSPSTTGPDAGQVTALDSPSSAPGTSIDNGGDTSLSSLVPTIDPTVAPSGTSMPTSFPTLSYSPVTSTPLSPAPAFPSLPGISNTTSQSTSSSISSNSTTSSSQSFTSSDPSSFSEFLTSIGVSSTGSTSITSFTSSTSTSSFSSATSTTTGGDGYSGDGENDGSTIPTGNSAAGDDSDSSDGPTVATVAGSVLGAVAGLAFILIIALVALRWKKRQNALKQGGPTGEQGTRALPEGNSGPTGGGGDMSEQQRSGPFAVPAALASLSGYKRFSKSTTASSDGGEKGFAKVSGRKLPPVIQFGGDGYSDPRATIMSDQSIEYRDSQNILGNPSSSRLAVGTPMRPDSGVPVFHAGPARTPVTEPNPFSSYEDTSPLEPPGRDPLGRSHPSHDGSTQSRGSVSRFTENL